MIMDQKDSFYVHKLVVIPQVQFLDTLLRLLDDARGDSTGAVHGQGDMPVVVASGADGQTAQKTVEIHQLQFLDKVAQISWCRGRFPWSRLSSRP